MTLQVASPAPFMPVRIRPCHGSVCRLDGGPYVLMNGTQHCVIHLVNFDVAPATVAGCIAGAAGALTVEAGDAFMLGWSVRDTAWRAVRMCGARIVGPDGIPPDPHPGPVPLDAAFLVEGLDGTTARCTLPTIAAYLAGTLPALPGPQSVPTWGSP